MKAYNTPVIKFVIVNNCNLIATSDPVQMNRDKEVSTYLGRGRYDDDDDDF